MNRENSVTPAFSLRAVRLQTGRFPWGGGSSASHLQNEELDEEISNSGLWKSLNKTLKQFIV